jgi:hypothetical protein
MIYLTRIGINSVIGHAQPSIIPYTQLDGRQYIHINHLIFSLYGTKQNKIRASTLRSFHTADRLIRIWLPQCCSTFLFFLFLSCRPFYESVPFLYLLQHLFCGGQLTVSQQACWKYKRHTVETAPVVPIVPRGVCTIFEKSRSEFSWM